MAGTEKLARRIRLGLMMKTLYQKPSKQELRKFGLVFGAFFALIFGVVIPLFRNGWVLFSDYSNLLTWPWLIAIISVGWALINPASLHLLHRPWMAFAELAAWINTRIIMLILFYFVILPFGLVMRLIGHDPMRRKFDSKVSSYRIMTKTQDKSHMKTPY